MLNLQEGGRLDAKRHCVIWAKALDGSEYLACWSMPVHCCTEVRRGCLSKRDLQVLWNFPVFVHHKQEWVWAQRTNRHLWTCLGKRVEYLWETNNPYTPSWTSFSNGLPYERSNISINKKTATGMSAMELYPETDLNSLVVLCVVCFLLIYVCFYWVKKAF